MLDEILYQLINAVELGVEKNAVLSMSKQELVVEVSVKTIADSFRKYLVWSNLQSLEKIFSNESDQESDKILDSIVNALIVNLMRRVRLPFGVSESTARLIIKYVINQFSRSMETTLNVKFDIYDLIYVFSGERMHSEEKVYI